uniref:Uncharacterized protein n=1 Tax=Arion vulgaris TaxID=1028688 RepID=A0A0B7AYE0_9EUPU
MNKNGVKSRLHCAGFNSTWFAPSKQSCYAEKVAQSILAVSTLIVVSGKMHL